MEKLLSIDELASMLQVPKKTVHQWRYVGHGPPALKVGRHLRFRPSDVERWLEERADRSVRR